LNGFDVLLKLLFEAAFAQPVGVGDAVAVGISGSTVRDSNMVPDR
jgi:hypothetical protein